MEDLYITDLIDAEILQKFQDAFSNMVGLAALTTDMEGKPVTEGSNFTNYCMKYTRQSEVGCERCKHCDIKGATTTLETGRPIAYRCHSGLIDFAAPIMLKDKMIGSFIGGQVLTEAPDKQLIRQVAQDIGVDFDEYWAALQEVPVMELSKVEAAAAFLFDTASVLSDIAYGKYQALEAQDETTRAANMKTDFLANMSHEIRTPMNAVIGMAEMALREEMSPAARDYIAQIKSSGNALLNIINDILDFSKIESGKMDIMLEEYEPMSLLHDISGILMTRLKDKEVELIVSSMPNIPRCLEGDSLRVRQILINLANNAIKFTRSGRVEINVRCEKKDDEHIVLKVAVSDTGIGIRKDDLNTLFESFRQVDSKRNRDIEGTGLGLAITKRLLDLMGGCIWVESVYGKGSTFTFELTQRVVDWRPSIEVEQPKEKMVIGYWGNIYLAKPFYRDMKLLGVDSVALATLDRYDELLATYEEDMAGRKLYMFTDEAQYDDDMRAFVEAHDDMEFVVMVDFYSTKKEDYPNVTFVKKPLSTIAFSMVFNNQDANLRGSDSVFEFDFIAPSATVLVVDDNEVNLTVSEGLLEPLKMRMIKAESGIRALDLIDDYDFDLIFMDHMMPELDGVETTKIIRKLHPRLDNVPIIALSANATQEARKMFLEVGMDDFVAKPIELRTIVAKIKQWLPDEKIEKGSFVKGDKVSKTIVVGDLNTAEALKLLGSEELFWSVLKKYYEAIEPKSLIIKDCESSEDITRYTVEVHALKSASKQIGAMELSEQAAELERAGNENNLFLIHAKTDDFLQHYISYIDVLKPYVGEEKASEKGEPAPSEVLLTLFEQMSEAVDNLDMDGMEDVITQMNRYRYEGTAKEYYERLKTAVANVDVDTCEEIIDGWKPLL